MNACINASLNFTQSSFPQQASRPESSYYSLLALADTFCIKMPLALYCYCLLVDSRQCTQHITKHAHDRIFTAKLLFQQYRVFLQKKKKKNKCRVFNTKFLGSLQGRLKSWAHLSQQILKGFIVPIRLYISKKSPKLYFKKSQNCKIIIIFLKKKI